jgi:hypothetical protein
MVAWLRQRSIKVSFISNGSLLSERHIASLLEAGVEKIRVSIESPDPDDFRRIRGGKLEKVIRNLEALMAARRAASLDRPVVGFSVTVLASTRKQLPAIYALYRRLGLDGGITLQPLQAMDSYARHYDDTRLQYCDTGGEGGVSDGKDACRHQPRIGRARRADGHGGHGKALGHLENGIETVDTRQRLGLHRHADHRDARFGGHHAGQMRRPARARDDDLQAAFHGRLAIGPEPVGRAMGRDDLRLIPYAQFIKDRGGLFHRGPVGLRPHDDSNVNGHARPRLVRLSRV